jgi:hypothetical protein
MRFSFQMVLLQEGKGQGVGMFRTVGLRGFPLGPRPALVAAATAASPSSASRRPSSASRSRAYRAYLKRGSLKVQVDSSLSPFTSTEQRVWARGKPQKPQCCTSARRSWSP